MNVLQEKILDNSFVLYKPITPNNEPLIRKTYSFDVELNKENLFSGLIYKNSNMDLFKAINEAKFTPNKQQKAGNWFDVWKIFDENKRNLTFTLRLNNVEVVYNAIDEKLSNGVLPECEKPFDRVFNFLIAQYNETLTKLYVEFTNQISFPADIDEYEISNLVNLGLIYPNAQQITVSTELGNTILYGICCDFNGVIEMKLFNHWHTALNPETLQDFLLDCVSQHYKLNKKCITNKPYKMVPICMAFEENFVFGTNANIETETEPTLVYVVDSSNEGRE